MLACVCVCNGRRITQQASPVMLVQANILVPRGHGLSTTTWPLSVSVNKQYDTYTLTPAVSGCLGPPFTHSHLWLRQINWLMNETLLDKLLGHLASAPPSLRKPFQFFIILTAFVCLTLCPNIHPPPLSHLLSGIQSLRTQAANLKKSHFSVCHSLSPSLSVGTKRSWRAKWASECESLSVCHAPLFI